LWCGAGNNPITGGVPSLLPKLREHKPLTPEDWKALEPLIVGDSESFVKYGADVATRRKNQSAATLPLLR
jgi:hypothetical protein